MALLDDALVVHVGVTVGDHPLVLPSAFAVDPDGPDEDGTLYLHGSVAAGWLRAAPRAQVCVTVTELDGLVAGRSAFHHSMNYRSAVVIGEARLVEDLGERQHALDLIVDHMLPGRAATLRPSTRKELAATAVVAVPLHEASMKERVGWSRRRARGRRRRRLGRPRADPPGRRGAGPGRRRAGRRAGRGGRPGDCPASRGGRRIGSRP